ncbi:MAG: hypothetical protein ACLFM7_10380 [Bacteroidales bacterium]
MIKQTLFFGLFFMFTMISSFSSYAQEDTIRPNHLPVKGLCIKAPHSQHVDEFVQFIHNELADHGVNTLVLRVDYNYEYQSRPELRQKNLKNKKNMKSPIKPKL